MGDDNYTISLIFNDRIVFCFFLDYKIFSYSFWLREFLSTNYDILWHLVFFFFSLISSFIAIEKKITWQVSSVKKDSCSIWSMYFDHLNPPGPWNYRERKIRINDVIFIIFVVGFGISICDNSVILHSFLILFGFDQQYSFDKTSFFFYLSSSQ